MKTTDPLSGTHEMPYEFNPITGTVFSIKSNDEWNQTHYTFVAPDGTEYRVAKDDVRVVCERPKEVPTQPPVGYGAMFESGYAFFRFDDGLWHPIESTANTSYDLSNGIDWEQVWEENGTGHWKALCPLMPDQIPLVLSIEGPKYTVVLPSLEEGEPTPGYVAFMTEDNGSIHIRKVAANVELEISTADFAAIMQMFVRSVWDMKAKDADTDATKE